MPIRFLTLTEVLKIHSDQVARYGGIPAIRDVSLLKSAIGAPAASFGGEYLHGDLFEIAAAYLFHLVQNHPFADGNKRTGAVAALIFLDLNGVDFTAPEEDLAQVVLDVASGKIGKSDVAGIFRHWSAAR